MLKREISLIAVPAVTVGMFAGCMSVRSTGGLLEQTDPATNVTSSKLRVLLADYVTQFGDRIEQAADEILSQTSDPQIHRNALLWKSNAISACFCAASRRDPLAAYLDVWILSRQMTQFLEQPSSNSVFGPWQAQALETSRQLETPLAQIQAMLHSNTRFEERFVDGFAREHPITSLYFCRASLAAPYIEEVDVDQTDGVLGHASPLRDAGRPNNQRHSAAFLPRRVFEEVFFLSHVPAVVGRHDDDGVVLERAIVHRPHDRANAIIHRRDTREVGLEKRLQAVVDGRIRLAECQVFSASTLPLSRRTSFCQLPPPLLDTSSDRYSPPSKPLSISQSNVSAAEL